MPTPRTAFNLYLGFLYCLCFSLAPILALGMGCGGGHKSGDRAGTVNWTMTIQPSAPFLIAGQTVQFSAQTPWGNEALWSVLPATAGIFTPGGQFTASATPGSATVYAVWAKDVRYTASTGLTILAAPAPAVTSPNLVQAFGAQQTVPGTAITNGAVVGELVPATTAASTNQGIQVRHGFEPPIK